MSEPTGSVVTKLMEELHDLRNEVKTLRSLAVMRDGETERDELPGLSQLLEFTITLARDGWHGEIECQVNRIFFMRLVSQARRDAAPHQVVSLGESLVEPQQRADILRIWGPTGRVTVVPGNVPEGCIWPVRPGMQIAPQFRGHVLYMPEHEIDGARRTMTLTSVRYDLVKNIEAIEVKP